MKTSQKICTVAGIAIAAVSTALAVDVTFRKKHHVLGLLAGLAGATAGALIAIHPVRMAMRNLELDDLFPDEEPEQPEVKCVKKTIVKTAPTKSGETATATDCE